MEAPTATRPSRHPVRQFSVFADNKVGRLHEILTRLHQVGLHVLALTSVDSTECTIVRLVVDYPEQAHEALEDFAFHFCETEVLVAEVPPEADLGRITAALLEAEINIHYAYPMLCRPNGHPALVLCLEDLELATQVLQQHQLKVLDQGDIAR